MSKLIDVSREAKDEEKNIPSQVEEEEQEASNGAVKRRRKGSRK